MKKEKDNKYHWKYEMNLYKNPTILFLLFKIFGCICLGIWLFSTLISVGNVDFWWNGFVDNLKVFVIITIIIFTLCILSYYLYSYIMGGKYNVLFEMDEKGIRHTQEEKQVKKAILLLTIVLIAYVGIIILAATYLEEGPLLGIIIAVSTTIAITVAFWELKIELFTGYYECSIAIIDLFLKII